MLQVSVDRVVKLKFRNILSDSRYSNFLNDMIYLIAIG
jgi:hypothetical protein